MSTLMQRHAACWHWFWRFFVLELALLVLIAHDTHAVLNITLDDTAPQIIYSPPACGLTLASDGTEICNSSWRIVISPNATSGTLTTSSGPNNASGGFIPQLFLTVKALGMSIKTSPNSTAIVNISVSTSHPIVSVTSQVNSSVQPISIIGLVEDRLTTLALTFEESNSSTVLDIDSIIVSISDNNTTPFVAPSPPVSTTLPTITPTIIIPASGSPQHHKQTRGDIAAEVLGSLLGAALIAGGAFLAVLFYRRRKRPLPETTEVPAVL